MLNNTALRERMATCKSVLFIEHIECFRNSASFFTWLLIMIIPSRQVKELRLRKGRLHTRKWQVQVGNLHVSYFQGPFFQSQPAGWCVLGLKNRSQEMSSFLLLFGICLAGPDN